MALAMQLLKPQSLVLKSNSLSIKSLIEYHHCLFHVIFIAHLLSLSEPLMESGNLCLMNQKKRQSSDWLSQRNFKDRWLKA